MGNTKKNKRTARFERARAKPSRFRVYPINRSGTSAVFAVGVDRTPDLSIFSAALSQLSYNGITIAPSGNRTRVESMATTHDTTTPMVLHVDNRTKKKNKVAT